MSFELIKKGIFRLKVPFEDLYTSVFAVYERDRIALVDTATTKEDVDTCIVPALNELIGREGGTLSFILLTHRHGDHAGGVFRLAELFEHVTVCAHHPMELPNFHQLCDKEPIFERLSAVHLPGHSSDSMGYLDGEHGLLLSGDCLQLRGVGKYTKGIRDRDAYVASIERLEKMKLQCIVASHDYVPLGYLADGKEAVAEYLALCKKIALES